MNTTRFALFACIGLTTSRATAADAYAIDVDKTAQYHQVGIETPQPNSFTVNAPYTFVGEVGFQPNVFPQSASLTTPVQVPLHADSNIDSVTESYASEAALNAAWPNGLYTFVTNTTHDGQMTVPVNLVGDAYPAIPQITSFAVTSPTTASFTWNSWADAPNNSHIFFQLTFPSTSATLELGAALDSDATSVAITLPAGTSFTPSSTYDFDLKFFNSVDTNTASYPGAIASAVYASDTVMRFTPTVEGNPPGIGDANGDGKVNLSDLNIVLNNLGTTTFLWSNGNFDGASTIDLTDLNDVLNNLGAPGIPDTVAEIDSTSTVPEPLSISFFGIGAILLIRR